MPAPLQNVTAACFGLSYLLALGLELARLQWPRPGLRTAGLLAGAAGLVAHSAFLAFRLPTPAGPYGSLLAVAWVLAVFTLIGTVRHGRQAWAVFGFPLVLGLVGLALLEEWEGGAGGIYSSTPPLLHSATLWGAVHGGLLLLAAVGLSVGFLASVMYLVQAARVRAKANPFGRFRLLSLERLEEMNRRAVGWAFVPLTLGLALGAVLMGDGPDPAGGWASVKVLGTAGLWVAFVVLFYLRYAAHVPGRRLAGLTVLAFGLMLVTLAAAHPRARGERGRGGRDAGFGFPPAPTQPGGAMNLRAVGCNFRTAPVGLRERVALDPAAVAKAVADLTSRVTAEAVVLATCNRVELLVARPPGEPPFGREQAAEFLAGWGRATAAELLPALYEHADAAGVRHLFRVAGSLDSLVVGEGQIAGQVKGAFELARTLGATGPLLNALVPHALRTAKRVRTETGISRGHVSVSSVAVDYVRQVFDHFADKTVLVIGAGKMGRLTLKHLRELNPGRILVTNRSPAKAAEVAAGCGGTAVPWADLDDALAAADIALSTTGAAEPVMPRARFERAVRPRRRGGPLVVLDIAVPRDFDPGIHDGDRVCVFNIDDLGRVRARTVADRLAHVGAAELIVEQEVRRFAADWDRRRAGPVIGKLTAEVDKVRAEVVGPLLAKLGDKLSAEERKYVEGAFRLFQNRVLHGPIAALQEASREGQGGTLGEVIKKVFRLGE